ncbi:unnamed protein product, partial [Rotaria socialis]
MASVAKKISEEQGIMADPNPKFGKRLQQNIAEKIISIYLSEDISRIMP